MHKRFLFATSYKTFSMCHHQYILWYTFSQNMYVCVYMLYYTMALYAQNAYYIFVVEAIQHSMQFCNAISFHDREALSAGAGTSTSMSRNTEWHKPKSRMFSGHLFYWFLCILFDLIKLWTTVSYRVCVCVSAQYSNKLLGAQCAIMHSLIQMHANCNVKTKFGWLHRKKIEKKACMLHCLPKLNGFHLFVRNFGFNFFHWFFYFFLHLAISYSYYSMIMHNDNRSRLSTPINWRTS